MVDENPPLTKQERRQRQKRLEQARLRLKASGRQRSPVAENADAAPAQDNSPAQRRGRSKRRDVTAADITGLKYFERLAPLLERLHAVGCERDTAGNRELHYDELCLFLLLGLFNPVVDGLRGLQQASELEKVQQRLKARRVSLQHFTFARTGILSVRTSRRRPAL